MNLENDFGAFTKRIVEAPFSRLLITLPYSLTQFFDQGFNFYCLFCQNFKYCNYHFLKRTDKFALQNMDLQNGPKHESEKSWTQYVMSLDFQNTGPFGEFSGVDQRSSVL